MNIFEISEFNSPEELEEIKNSKFSLKNNYKIFGFGNSNALLIDIIEIKKIYLEKFKASITENFSRVFYLIILQEKSLENNFTNFEVVKEILISDNVNLHLINYIKQMSWSYIDLLDEFNLHSEEHLLSSDFFLNEMSHEFSLLLNKNYFSMIYLKLDEFFIELKGLNIFSQNNLTANSLKIPNDNINLDSPNKKEAYLLVIFKYFYYLNVVNKMNDVLLSFKSSNIKYLITDELKIDVERNIEKYTQLILNDFLKRIMKDVKFILMNKDGESL